jgi:hypothetical protein
VTGEAFGLVPDSLPIFFFVGPFDIVGAAGDIRRATAKLDRLAAVIVDTAAAFFAGDDDNSNVLFGQYARDLRQLTKLSGKPAVIVNAHPIKGATAKDQMVPRGGGAFLAEVDGNLSIFSADRGETTELHWTGKLRGSGFEPMTFRLERRTSDRLRDAKGRSISSVVAVPMTEGEAQAVQAADRSDEDAMLDMLVNCPNFSIADWAKQLGWLSPKNDAPQKSKVYRTLERLKTDKLAEVNRGKWRLTSAGRKEAERVV